jgi:hypothetical protein
MITDEKYVKLRAKLLYKMRRLIALRDDINFRINKVRNEMKSYDNILLQREKEHGNLK